MTAQCKPPRYTFDNTAWTLGGPVLIPGTDFNKGRNKLFFFFSQDLLPRTDPGGLNQRRMPTALERRGDFSQTFDSQNRLHLHPRSAAGGQLQRQRPAARPASRATSSRPSRINPIGAGAAEPVPAAERDRPDRHQRSTTTRSRPCRTGRATTRCCASTGTSPQNTTFYGRACSSATRSAPAACSFLGSGGGWPQLPSKYEIDTVSFVNTLLHTFSSTTVLAS